MRLLFLCGYLYDIKRLGVKEWGNLIILLAGVIEGLPDDTTPDALIALGISCCGYALGIIVACFVYREATCVLCRGIFNSIDGLVKTDRNLSFNNPYISHPSKVAYLIQSLLNL